jgi:N-6 DNA Methylase/Type I restriction enzyme R protein N terminus (HSDR_N)/Eco57I restriction-modification methylase
VDVYRALGYAISGRDYRNKTRDVSGVPDVLLHNSDRSIQVVVELKKPSENLENHRRQLEDYLRSLAEARWGLLSNGKQWRAYQRNGKAIDLVWEYSIAELEADPSLLLGFERQTIEVTNFTQIETRLKRADGEALVPKGLSDLATQEFLFTFSLQEGSPFAALVGATQDLLNSLEPKSAFVKGAYDFWKKVYARELDAEDIPKLWRDSKLAIAANKEGLYKFSFALETAYTLTARLILAKAIQDKDASQGIIKAHLADRLLEHLKAKRNLRTGTLKAEHYLEATVLLFDDYARTLFTSIYGKDIFDWWRDYEVANDNARRDFARAVADLEIALLRFDFRTMEGDLLGEMYQRYFDADTRKALGEFYTPKAVVDYILDSVGYHGEGTLLDPATGSGTFIVSALRRYLKKNRGRNPLETLRGITEEFRLVAFDVNPFAVIMAQIGFATELIDLYTKAIAIDPKFVLRRLPIVRTDSLRKETMEGKAEEGMFNFSFEELKVTLELPVKTTTTASGFLEVTVTFPHLETAKQKGVVKNVRDWLMAMQSVFAAVEVLSQAKDRAENMPELKAVLRDELAKRHPQPEALTDYLERYANGVWETLLDLKINHGDGRFLKTLEDLMLGLVLKHYLRYQFVIGNPPYVSVQNIPENLHRYWESRYDWVQPSSDIFVPFIERALHGSRTENGEEECWLEQGGKLGFIVPNRFMNVEYVSAFRAQLPGTATLLSITDFKAVKFKPNASKPSEAIFEEARVYPAVIVAENTTPTEPYTFRAARMYPTEAMLEPAEALKAITNAKVAGANSVRLQAGGRGYADVFLEHSQNLHGAGWYMMPADERAVFDKLEAIGNSIDPELPISTTTSQHRRLRNYTATSSGGFQGIITGLDEVMVLKELERDDAKGLLKAYPKGGKPEDATWLEMEVLRPFLFGKMWIVGMLAGMIGG